MALATLAEIRAHCQISASDTSETTQLTQWLRGCSSAIRKYVKSYMGGVITSNSVAAATVINAPGHGLVTGDTILIAGSDSTPTIDGSRVVTRLTQDTFSVPVTVTVAGSLGYWSKQYTEYYSGTGTKDLGLKQRPVQSIISLYQDPTAYFGQNPAGAFGASTLLTEGADFVLKRDNANQTEVSLSGKVLKINGYWYRPQSRMLGLMGGSPGDSMGSIKVTYTAGWMPIQDHHREACCEYVKQIRRGVGMSSEHYDYYSYTLDPIKDRENVMGGVRDLLSDIKKWVW